MQALIQEKYFLLISAKCTTDLALELYTLSFYPQLTRRIREVEMIRDEKGSGNLEIQFYFTYEETETQRGGIICSRPHN